MARRFAVELLEDRTVPSLGLPAASFPDDFGNTRGTAHPIVVASYSGPRVQMGIIEAIGDVDVFQFVAPVSARLALTLQGPLTRQGGQLTVLDGRQHGGGRNDRATRVEIDVAAGQTNFVQVNGRGPSTGAYALVSTVVSGDGVAQFLRLAGIGPSSGAADSGPQGERPFAAQRVTSPEAARGSLHLDDVNPAGNDHLTSELAPVGPSRHAFVPILVNGSPAGKGATSAETTVPAGAAAGPGNSAGIGFSVGRQGESARGLVLDPTLLGRVDQFYREHLAARTSDLGANPNGTGVRNPALVFFGMKDLKLLDAQVQELVKALSPTEGGSDGHVPFPPPVKENDRGTVSGGHEPDGVRTLAEALFATLLASGTCRLRDQATYAAGEDFRQ